ncbi:MAG TPA: hypothetical protein ENI72_00025 [Rhodospirillales bacterium]|nr:hypothetical protein [Rhodospirillales bacterium]
MDTSLSDNVAGEIERLRSALKERPNDAGLLAGLGKLLRVAGNTEKAKRRLSLAIALDPTQIEPLLVLGNTHLRECETNRALACFGLAQTYSPQDWLRFKMAVSIPPLVQSLAHIAVLREGLGRALGALSKLSLRVKNPPYDGASLFYLAYYGQDDKSLYEAFANLHLRFDPDLAGVAPHCIKPRPRDDEPRIKVGFISTFFYEHSIGRLTRGIIEGLDREKFHVTVVMVSHAKDALTDIIARSADRALEIPRDLDRARLVVAKEELDVIVYPDIGMDSLTYCLACARLAPVQCLTWGHPVTSGIPSLDYFVSAEDLETEGSEDHYSEALYKLKCLGTYYYRPESPKKKKRSDFGLKGSPHYYFVPQYLFKIHPEFDLLIAAILDGDPKGRVLFIDGIEGAWKNFLRARFQKTIPGVADRIDFTPWRPQRDFLALMANTTVVLDIPHFNGGNTTIEAFFAGVPVVTMPTRFARGRFSAAIMKQIGLDECIAETPKDYVDLAVRIGTDLKYRKSLRAKIRKRIDGIFENDEAIREWERFFIDVCGRKDIGPPKGGGS